MARNSVCKKVVRDDGTGIDFNFANGEVRPFDIAKLDSIPAAFVAFCLANPDHAVTRGFMNGYSQKIGDDFAGVGGNVEEAIENTDSMIERLYGGEWSAEREAAGPRPSLVADAVIRVATAKGLTFDPAAVRAKYIGKDGAAKRKEALTNAEIKAAYDAIRAENAAAKAAESAKLAAGATADIGAML